MHEGQGKKSTVSLADVIAGVTVVLFLTLVTPFTHAQSTRELTPIQAAIAKQQERLGSTDEEERRDALMRLGAMHREAASRAALPLLSDPSPIVRVTAAKAILSLDPAAAASSLLPLLNDKDEFVRREVAYALGATRSRSATTSLVDHLLNDKQEG